MKLVAPVIGAIATVVLLSAPAAEAKTALAELRVEGPGVSLDPGTWYVTGRERVRKSSPSDECDRTSGHINIAGPTPLSLLGTGEATNSGLQQVRVRQDETGLFVCEIGSILGRTFTDPAGFAGWSYYDGFTFGSSAADQLELKNNDRITWVFSDFGSEAPSNTGDLLQLKRVPARSDGKFNVKVVGHRFDGTVNPALGVAIEGSETSTELGNGRYQVTVAPGFTTLFATNGLDVPSNRLETCTAPDLSACPKAHGRTIVGSGKSDDLAGTRGFDDITGRGGGDVIDLTDGGSDAVACGGGDDKVLVNRGDSDNDIAGDCEKVKKS